MEDSSRIVEFHVFACPACLFVTMSPCAARRHEAQVKCHHSRCIKTTASAPVPKPSNRHAQVEVTIPAPTDEDRRAHFFETPHLADFLLYECSKGDILRRLNHVFIHVWGFKAPERLACVQTPSRRNAIQLAADVIEFTSNVCAHHVPRLRPDLSNSAADVLAFLRDREHGISLADAVLRNESWNHKRGSLRYMTARGSTCVSMIHESMKLADTLRRKALKDGVDTGRSNHVCVPGESGKAL